MRAVITICMFLSASLLANDLDRLYDDSQVAIIEISMDPLDLEWMYANVHSDSLHPATIHFSNATIDETHEQVGIRLRGNTSRGAAKKSFKLSFNSFVPGRKFYDVEKLNLNGEHNDPSIMRSKLAWDLYARTGLQTTRAAHCAVYINDVYYGLYINVEHIDDEFLSNHFEDDSGNLWKCLWPADLTYRGPDPEDYHPYQDDTHPYELKTNTSEYDYTQLARLIDVINNTAADNFSDSLEQVLAVHEVLQYAAMNVIMGNWDDYWFLRNNFYLYHEPATDRFHWIPYDYDNSFGIDWFNVDWTSVDPYSFMTIEAAQGQSPGDRPLMENIMANARYRDLYSHFLTFFAEGIARLDHWEAHVDSLKTLITPYAIADTYRTLDYGFSIPDFFESYSPNSYENQHVKKGLKQFVTERLASLESHIQWENTPPIIYEIDYQPKIIGPLDSVHVVVSAFSHIGLDDMTIAFHPGNLTVVLPYPMRPAPLMNSSHIEDLDRWVGVIPPMGDLGHGRFQVGVEDHAGQSALYPGGHFIELAVTQSVVHPLRINEFMALNQTTLADPAGEFDDWLELYNAADTDTYLSGMYLTDDPNDLTKWQFPQGGNYMLPHSYALIWCDEDQEQPGVHVNFKLSGSGEFLALVDVDGQTIIDAINFGPQEEDVSYGREHDGGEPWVYFAEATPGASNSSVSTVTLQVPLHATLQNHPNPFNGQTMIQFEILDAGHLELIIHDLKGREVMRLLDAERQPGMYQIAWNGRDQNGEYVAAGVYVVSLKQARSQMAIKVVILK
jgi:spore coat protein H